MDYVKGKHRGFAFVEYEDADDADEAIFNMDGAELSGRTVSVSVAQPNQVNRLLSDRNTANTFMSSSNNPSYAAEAVWTSDEWFQKQVGLDKEEIANQRDRETDAKTLQEM
jgi:peptidyl-prolyl isomerase E (cyclophilin E)